MNLRRIYCLLRLAMATALMMPGFYPLIRNYLSGGDVWKSAVCPVPHFNSGAPLNGHYGHRLAGFRSYLEGDSIVEPASIEEICTWLADCEYVAGGSNVQHPSEFERTRKGDCCDHAVWAWRKLVEMGYDAELVFGAYSHPPFGGHAWLIFQDRGRQYLLESVCKESDGIVAPLRTARELY